MKHEHQEIVSLERRFWEEANNPQLFREAFADDGLTILEPIGYIEKDQAVEMSAKGKPFTNVVMEDVHIRELTPDCVALAYHGQGTADGQNEPYRGSICSIYVRRSNRWQLAVTDHQKWDPGKGHG